VGFQNSANGLDLGLLRGSLVFVDELAENGSALDPLLGEVGDGVVGAGRTELAAAMGVPSVVVLRASKTCVTWADALLSAVPRPVPGEPVLARPDVR
jgi:hypothetical protein